MYPDACGLPADADVGDDAGVLTSSSSEAGSQPEITVPADSWCHSSSDSESGSDQPRVPDAVAGWAASASDSEADGDPQVPVVSASAEATGWNSMDSESDGAQSLRSASSSSSSSSSSPASTSQAGVVAALLTGASDPEELQDVFGGQCDPVDVSGLFGVQTTKAAPPTVPSTKSTVPETVPQPMVPPTTPSPTTVPSHSASAVQKPKMPFRNPGLAGLLRHVDGLAPRRKLTRSP